MQRRRHFGSRCVYLYGASVVFLALCLTVLLMNIYELRLIQADHVALHANPSPDAQRSDTLYAGRHFVTPVVWVYSKNSDVSHLSHVIAVFERLGYTQGGANSNWNVLWAHEYPFHSLDSAVRNLKPHQKVNHFPGSGFITNKANLAVSAIDAIPKAFKIPDDTTDFLNYVQLHPNAMWVQKSSVHRGIQIISAQDIDVHKSDTFVQQYVDDPFLIDGRRFDIGLYVTLTSIEPLRVYVYQGEWLIRFCKTQYYPFDARDTEKYVIGDDYTPLWEIPSLSQLYTGAMATRKQALFSYLKQIGKDPHLLSAQLEAAVRQVYLVKAPVIWQFAKNYSSVSSLRSYFEMVRFDFILDKELRPYLMEVNMSPNLSSGHFPANKLLYEQVIYSMLHLVGIATPVFNTDSSADSSDTTLMQVSPRDVAVNVHECTVAPCNNTCENRECQLCSHCIRSSLHAQLEDAYLEHLSRHTWRRVLPQPFQTQDHAGQWQADRDVTLANQTAGSLLMAQWFQAKCVQDATWCI